MGNYFTTMFEVTRQERLLLKSLSLWDPINLKQSKLTDHETEY